MCVASVAIAVILFLEIVTSRNTSNTRIDISLQVFYPSFIFDDIRQPLCRMSNGAFLLFDVIITNRFSKVKICYNSTQSPFRVYAGNNLHFKTAAHRTFHSSE